MYSHAAATVRGSLQTGASAHSLSAGYASSDGYIANSDYRLFSALWQSRLTTEAARIDFQFGVNDKEYGANTFYSAKYPNQFDDTRSVFGVLRGEAGNRLKLIPQLYWNRHYDHYQLIRNTSTGENFHQTDVFGFNLNAQYRWAGGTTNLGGEIRNEGILSSNLGKDSIFDQANYRKTDHRSHIHYFLEHTYLHGGWTLSAGLMFHYNTAFPDASGLFPAIHTAYWLTGRVKLFASWSKAIRMPTFTDLSYTGPTHTGHSNVRPEQSESFDAGFQYHHPVGTVSISGFYMKAIEPIDWVKSLPGDPWEARNLDDFAKTGFEANVVWRFGSSAVHLGYRWMNQNQNDAGWITYYLDDYIRHKFTASLSHPVYKGISAEWQFRRQNRQGTYTQYENNESTGREVAYLGFSLLDLRLNWQLRDFRIHLTGNNLFNVSYYDLGNIPQPGFWLIGGVSWTMH
ncbi:MAG: TonB-dependent receptor [Dysgonamonadaceae bacterium]|nr:TonB-dependent receptor [Dysgonamonadaceae bacterium]